MKPEIVLVGGGGHCKSVMDALICMNQFHIWGVVDVEKNLGKEVLGIPIRATDQDLSSIYEKHAQHAAITLGSIGNIQMRRKLHQKLMRLGFAFPAIIDPSAIVSESAQIGQGVFIGKKAVVNAQAKIEELAIINTGAIVEHDCRIGKFSHVAPGVVMSGEVTVGDNVHLGTGCTLIQGIHVVQDVVIGAGSVVISDILESGVYVGCPCRRVK